MKILVTIKRVIDPNVHIHLKADGSGIDSQNTKMSVNPFDEIALEEAIRLKELGLASEVVVVSAGISQCQEILRTALAMGADRGILLQTEQELQPLAVAKLLKYIAIQENPRLIIMGKQAIDDDCNQTGQMLAGLLDWPQGTFISQLIVKDDEIVIKREVDGGLEVLGLKLPAVLTTDLRLNHPRYLSLPNIMKAKTKPIQIINADSLGLELQPRLQITNLSLPATRKTGIKLSTVDELLTKLKEVQVI